MESCWKEDDVVVGRCNLTTPLIFISTYSKVPRWWGYSMSELFTFCHSPLKLIFRVQLLLFAWVWTSGLAWQASRPSDTFSMTSAARYGTVAWIRLASFTTTPSTDHFHLALACHISFVMHRSPKYDCEVDYQIMEYEIDSIHNARLYQSEIKAARREPKQNDLSITPSSHSFSPASSVGVVLTGVPAPLAAGILLNLGVFFGIGERIPWFCP